MTYRIVTFSYVNNDMGATISVTYNAYNEDGSIHRTNLRRSMRVDEANTDLVQSFETIKKHILDTLNSL